MRYGIFSDVHSNLEALHVVLESLQNEKIDSLVCLGDMVGYASNPNECIELIKGLNPLIIAGNHDFAVADIINFNYFNKWAKEAVFWTQKHINLENGNFLKKLKLRIDSSPGPCAQEPGSKVTFVHANPYLPEKWIYVLTFKDALKCFSFFDSWICFIGHSHCPFIFELDEEGEGRIILFDPGDEVKLQADKRYVINAGSVGQPRDGDRRACYMVFDNGTQKITIKRMEYNYKLTQKKIIEAGLPKFLAERLEVGK